MKFGGITLDPLFGGLSIANIPANRLPQEAASAAYAEINSGIVGATYMPIWYIGYQQVHGRNHWFISREIRTTKDQDQAIVLLVVNALNGKFKVVAIYEDYVLGEQLDYIFNAATNVLIGVNYKPLCYLGSQTVKGINHYFLAQAKPIYPHSQPYAVQLCVNEFEKQISLVSVERIEDSEPEVKLGYAFSW